MESAYVYLDEEIYKSTNGKDDVFLLYIPGLDQQEEAETDPWDEEISWGEKAVPIPLKF